MSDLPATSPTPSLVCTASVTPRTVPAENEDAVAEILPANGHYRGVAAADGLGSVAYAGQAARFTTERVCALLHDAPAFDNLECLFRRVQIDLLQHAREHAKYPALPAGRSWVTTLLVALELEQHFLCGYVGNGAIWHIRGDFNRFPPEVYLPWSFSNYLNPHSLPMLGKETLYGVLAGSPDTPPPCVTTLTVSKDRSCGDLLLVCTDGIYSSDQVTLGKDVNGRAWVSVEEPMLRLYHSLRAFFDEPLHQWSSTSLRMRMEQYLYAMHSDGLLDDDASIGLIVTGGALDYQRRRALG